MNFLPISLSSSFETTSSNMVLTIRTERTYYLRGEIVQILGTTKDSGGFPIQGATIAIEVKNPSGSTIFLDIVYSLSDGSFSDSFRLSSIASVGQYTVYATASKTGYNSATQSTFFYVTTNDLFIVSIEPIQVISDAEALIKNKRTAIRVVVANGFSERKWADIRITYDFASKTYDELGPSGTGVPLDPGLNRIYVPGGPAFPAQAQPWISEEQPPWLFWTTTGPDDSIKATIDPFGEIPETNEGNNEGTTSAKVTESKSLRILYVPVAYLWDTPVNPTQMQLHSAQSSDFINGTYPSSGLSYVVNTIPFYPPFYIPINTREVRTLNMYYVLLQLVEMSWFGYDRVVGVVPVGWLSTYYEPGVIGIADPNMVGVLVEYGYWTTAAHEIGHTYGLYDEYLGGRTKKPIEHPDGDWASGFWVAHREPKENTHCFMGTGNFESFDRWICDESFSELLSKFRVGTDPEIIGVSGLIFKNGTVQIGNWYYLPYGDPDIPIGQTGNYTIKYLDAQDLVLSETAFNLSFTVVSDPPFESNVSAFGFRIPFVAGTKKIMIVHSGETLEERMISTHSPDITLTFPNSGEILFEGMDYTITWDGLDLDGDPLTYSLAYSWDEGQNWIPLALNVTENSYVWNTSTLRSGNRYLVKVIGTDGINTGQDTSSNAFTVTIQGDITGDFVVNVNDLFSLGKAYGSMPSSPNWNRNADINNDLIVNVVDLEILQKNYGKTVT